MSGELPTEPGVFVPHRLYADLVERADLLQKLLDSGRLWWIRYEPIHGVGERVMRVPLTDIEDVQAEFAIDAAREGDDE